MANPLFDKLFAPHIGSTATFLILPNGDRISYSGFLDQTAHYANVIRDSGLEVGDRLAVQIEKSPEALAVCAACALTGTVFLPLNIAYALAELSYFLNDSSARLFLCDPKNHAALKTIAQTAGAQILTLGPNGEGSLADAASTKPKTCRIAQRSSRDLAALLYTSGTTGRSKGATLSQGNLLSNAEALTELWHFTAHDTLLHALPIFHTHGLFFANNVTLSGGGAMMFPPKLDVEKMINGLPETNMSTSNPHSGERRAGSVGFPLPGVDLKITDPNTGIVVPQGGIGGIEVRGANVFQGYWNMPKKNC